MEMVFSVALSFHMGFNGDYNQIHPHIGFRNEEYIFGGYINSENNISLYGGMKTEFEDFELEYGIATGYNELGSIVPMIRGTYKIKDNMLLFISPGGEIVNGEKNFGIVYGIEIKIK